MDIKEKMLYVLQRTLDAVKEYRDFELHNDEWMMMEEFNAYCRFYYIVTGESVIAENWKVVVKKE